MNYGNIFNVLLLNIHKTEMKLEEGILMNK